MSINCMRLSRQSENVRFLKNRLRFSFAIQYKENLNGEDTILPFTTTRT